MKQSVSILICVALAISCVMISTTAFAEQADFSLDAIDFVKNFKAGWNLGNTFEATDRWNEGWSDAYTVNDVETGWGNPTTTQAMFDKVAQQGFNAVRIPISWYRWVDDDNDYKINDDFLARIKEVVGYAYNNDLYVIINMHHDDKDWLDIGVDSTRWKIRLEKYNAIWEQISNAFKNYDEHLLFEGANEVINGNNWWGSDADLARVNELHKNFVNTVRSTGGNNEQRYLLLSTLGAQWYKHQWGALKIPNNDKHCIIDIHWYSTNVADFNTYMSAIGNGLVAKGTAVIFGECGINRNCTESEKASWASAYFGTAYSYGIPAFIWDDGGDFRVLNRHTLNWVTQSQVDEIVKAVGLQPPTTTTTIATTIAQTTAAPKTTARTTTPTTAAPTTVAQNTSAPTTATRTTVVSTTAIPTTAAQTTTARTTSESKIVYGDLNSDGKVNLLDLIALRKYVAKWNMSFNEKAADCNADGKVNILDLILLRKHLAKWNVQLGK